MRSIAQIPNVANTNRQLVMQSSNATLSVPQNLGWDQQIVSGANYLANGAINSAQIPIQFIQDQIEHERKHLSFWGFLKKHVFEGFLERVFWIWALTEIANHKFHVGGSVGTAIASVLGLIAGEVMVQLEHKLEDSVEKAMKGPDFKYDKEDLNWDLAKFIAKTLSISILSLIGVAKKMFFFYDFSKTHNPSKPTASTRITKTGQESLVESFGKYFKQDTKEVIEKLRDPNLNILDSFEVTSRWFAKTLGKSSNSGTATLGKFMSGVFEKFIGCPSMAKGLHTGKLNTGMILKDASFKLAFLIPLGVGLVFFVNQFRKLINELIPKEKDYVLESSHKQVMVNA
ncbi:MAG: hypothetical protein QNJ31_08150 [Candidatus Caenarcaniphilales bacterium]|nr:hypothetical protein [Candidatus Caenarcaniphilales bacterium]